MPLKNPNKYQEGKTLVFFVRHGDRKKVPEKDKEKSICYGLSSVGKKQAKEVAKQFYKIKNQIDVIYSSSLNRAIETAKEISKEINKQPLIKKELCEFNKIVWKKKFLHLKYWKHYFKHKASLREFNKILESNKGKIIIIVAHGNIIKGIIGKKLKISFNQIRKFDNENCHITLARFSRKKLDYLYYFNSKNLVMPTR